jgi:cytochrome d ubiquinol oxidase subunit II
LLVAFPVAHGTILTALYLPVAIMLIGLILRGVAFEFRAKAPAAHKGRWDAAFFGGSLMAAMAQGFMLGLYVMGLGWSLPHVGFALLTAVFLTVAYSFIGATWVILKTDGLLQVKAVTWARGGIWGIVLGMAAISAATPLVSASIFDKWFSFPELLWLAPLPLATAALVFGVHALLRHMPLPGDAPYSRKSAGARAPQATQTTPGCESGAGAFESQTATPPPAPACICSVMESQAVRYAKGRHGAPPR